MRMASTPIQSAIDSNSVKMVVSIYSTEYRDKSRACLMRALLLFIGIPYKITLRMIRFVMKVCRNASLTLVVVQI